MARRDKIYNFIVLTMILDHSKIFGY